MTALLQEIFSHPQCVSQYCDYKPTEFPLQNHIRSPDCSANWSYGIHFVVGGVCCSSLSGSLQRNYVLLADVEVISGPVVSFPHRLPHKQPHGFSVVL